MSRRTLIHSSGRFDRSQASLRRSVLALREQGSLITHTELSSVPLSLFDGPGWEAVRVAGSGRSEYVIEHDTRVFTRLEVPTAHRLSSLFYYRASGSRAAFFYAITVPYLDVETGARFVVLVTHAPLDNTKRRARVWVSQAAGWVRLVKALRKSHPGYQIIGLGDWNKNYRSTSERAAIEKHMAAPAGLRQSWDSQLTDDKGGSHGSSQIIDGALTDAKVIDCDLLPDDDSSDHRPVGITVEFAAAPVVPVPTVPVVPVPTTPEVPVAPDPYGRSYYHDKLLDNATIAALKAAEEELGYELTIFQGIGGAAASAGTHTEGRAADGAPWDYRRKLAVLRKHGFIGWYRPTIRGLWSAHFHVVLVLGSFDNQRGIAGSAFRQIGSYMRGRSGLKGDARDTNTSPSEVRPFQYPPKVEAKPVTQTPLANAKDALTEAAHALGVAAVEFEKSKRPTKSGRVRFSGFAATSRTIQRTVAGLMRGLPKK